MRYGINISKALDKSKLVKKVIIDKNGKRTTRWIKLNKKNELLNIKKIEKAILDETNNKYEIVSIIENGIEISKIKGGENVSLSPYELTNLRKYNYT